MKTKTDFKKVNVNEYAFFKGIGLADAKSDFADILFPDNWYDDPDESKYLTAKGYIKISASEYVDVKKLDFTMRSNSNLDGLSSLDYLCDFYNKGLPLNTLREFSEHPTMIKNIAFTGVKKVINDILNPDQLKQLQKNLVVS